MILIRLALTLAVPLLIGYCITALILRNKSNTSILERFGLAWGIGLGLLGIGMFNLSLLGIILNLQTILIPSLSIILALAGYLLSKKIPIFDIPAFKKFLLSIIDIKNEKNRWIKAAQILLILLISLTILYVFFDALVKPITTFDALWRQGSVAKIIFTSGRVMSEQTTILAAYHPYLNPLSQAWIHIGIGTWNDALGKIVFPLCFTSLIFIFYSGIRRYTGRLYSLVFTYLLTSFPLLVFHAGTAYSDLMLTFYYATGIIYLYHWMESRENSFLYISALFLGIGIFIKQLGTPLWIIAAFVLFLFIIFEGKRQFKPLIHFILLSSIISLTWLLNKYSFINNYILVKFLPHLAPTNLVHVFEKPIYGKPTLPSILAHLGKRMYTYADWQILWFVFPTAIVLCWQRLWQSKLKYIGLIVLLNFLMMLYGFSGQNAYNYLVEGTTVQRMIMFQTPLALFMIALLTYAALKEKCLCPK